jgi:hypothetical protein
LLKVEVWCLPERRTSMVIKDKHDTECQVSNTLLMLLQKYGDSQNITLTTTSLNVYAQYGKPFLMALSNAQARV